MASCIPNLFAFHWHWWFTITPLSSEKLTIDFPTYKLPFTTASYVASLCRSRRCHVPNASFHFNTSAKQHRAWIVIGWETIWKLQMLLEWVQILVLLRGEWTESIRAPPLVVAKQRYRSQVEIWNFFSEGNLGKRWINGPKKVLTASGKKKVCYSNSERIQFSLVL